MKMVLSEYTKNRDNNFNLIRFIAASLVLFTHSFALAIGSGDAEPLRSMVGMTWGSIAVDVFFVTSGFLIASSFFERNNIVAFIWARFLRIFPALFVAIVFCTFIVGLFFTTYPTSEYLLNPETHKYFIKNIILFVGVAYQLPGVFADIPYKNAVNGSLWTLPYEVTMYVFLAFFGLILIHIRKKISCDIVKYVFLFIALVAVAANLVNHFYPYLSVKFIHLFSMFFVGSAFFVCRDNIWLSYRAFYLILLILLLSVFNQNIFFVIYCILLPYMIFVMAYVPAGGIRGFNKLGDYSYGIYIYAFPVQQSIAALVPGVTVVTMILLSFFITFLLSILSWHFIEKKFLKMKGQYVVIVRFLSRNTPNKSN